MDDKLKPLCDILIDAVSLMMELELYQYVAVIESIFDALDEPDDVAILQQEQQIPLFQ